MHLFPSMEYHSSTSELIQMLKKGHHEVEMDETAYRTLYAWIDLNVPYHATWVEERDKGTDQCTPNLLGTSPIAAFLWIP